VLIGTASLLVNGTANARRAIPDDNLLYPVLITVESQTGAQSFGSGFYLSKDGITYLVTAKHVLIPPPFNGQPFIPITLKCMSYSSKIVQEDRIYDTAAYTNLNAQGLIKLSPDRDVAVVKLAYTVTTAQPTGEPNAAPTEQPGVNPQPTQQPSGPTGQAVHPPANDSAARPQSTYLQFYEGFIVSSEKSANMRTATVDLTKADVLVSNDTIVYGYPRSLALDVSTAQLDPLQPLLRRGLIAGVNDKNKTIILDSASYRGNSGAQLLKLNKIIYDKTSSNWCCFPIRSATRRF